MAELSRIDSVISCNPVFASVSDHECLAEAALLPCPLGSFTADTHDCRLRRFDDEFARLTRYTPRPGAVQKPAIASLLGESIVPWIAQLPERVSYGRDCQLSDGRTLRLRVYRHRHILRGWVEDVSQLRRFESELRHAAQHDALTGLANRAVLEAHLSQAIAQAELQPQLLVYMDLDGFKAINDHIGHAAGDAVLCEFASLLSAQLRRGELAARVGGDEFVMLLRGERETLTHARRARLREVMSGLGIRLRGIEWKVRASIGCIPLRADMTPQGALAAADRRCAAGKARGVYHRSVRPPRHSDSAGPQVPTRKIQYVQYSLRARP